MPTSPQPPPSEGSAPRRWAFGVLGLASIGVGFVGVFLPGLPTTIFLLFASYCFARSYPPLEKKLVQARVFRPFHRYMDRDAEMPLRARIITILIIWAASAVSCATMHARGKLEVWFVVTIAVAAAVGSIVVWRMFRGPRNPAPADADSASEPEAVTVGSDS